TFASPPSRSTTSTIRPGMPRHTPEGWQTARGRRKRRTRTGAAGLPQPDWAVHRCPVGSPGSTLRGAMEPVTIPLDGLDALVSALLDRGYCVVGPTRRDGAIVYEELTSAADLPAGWTEVQEAGSYRLERRDDEARFGYPVGAHSWKRHLLP